MKDLPNNNGEKRRVIALIPAAAIVVSNMIGTGIFTTTGLMVAQGASGGDILLAWLIGGIIALCGALCYGELGANLSGSGGEYHYLSRLLHPALGFMAGWVSLIVGFAAPIAAAAMAMQVYLARVIPGWPVRMMAVAVIVSLAVLHAYDLRLGSKVQTALIGVKVLLILAFILSGLVGGFGSSPTNLTQLSTSVSLSPSFAVSLIFVSFAYSGWNAAAYIGAELQRPERTLPWSLLLGTVTVTALYLLLNLTYLSVVPLAQLSGIEDVAHVVGNHLWGARGGQIVSLLIAFSLTTPISAMTMIGPRVAEAMARDGFLPGRFAKLNRRNVPAWAVGFQAVLAVLFALSSSFSPLLIYIGFTLSLFTALTVFSLFRLRKRPDIRRVCLGYPLTPIIFIGFALWSTVWSIQSQPVATLAGLGTLLLGCLAYLSRRRHKLSPKQSVATASPQEHQS
jgi:APA family basic amino acid/polyamine antiporter